MIKYLAGPLIGMVIGYFTNYIAVKMLFRPHEEKYILGHRVPLTPGAIPKGKSRLAKAAGAVVSETLITGNDITDRLLADEMESHVVDSIMDILKEPLEQTARQFTRDDQVDEFVEGVENAVTDKVVTALKDYDFDTLIKVEGSKAIKEKLGDSMLALFISDDMISGILDSVVQWINNYIDFNAEPYVRPLVDGVVDDVKSDTPLGLADRAGYDEEEVRKFVTKIYRQAATSGVAKALEHIDIATVVEDKINAMSVEELERVVLEVMKNELNMIVNLGALIGFMLGLLNIFI